MKNSLSDSQLVWLEGIQIFVFVVFYRHLFDMSYSAEDWAVLEVYR